MSDTPEPTLEPAAAPVPAKRGRKPAAEPKPVDTRPLNVRCKEAYDMLRSSDGVIRGELRKIENCEREMRDAHNRLIVARGAVRARERGLEQEAVEIIRKETGIQTIPGFNGPKPKPLSAWLRGKQEIRAKLRAAKQEARMQLTPEPPTP